MSRLKELRIERQKTQQQLVDELNETFSNNEKPFSKMNISNWENGKHNIKPEKAQQLADYFGVSVGYLLGYDEEQKVYDSRSSPYQQKKLDFLKDIEEVKKIKTDTLIALEFVENIFSQLSQHGRVRPGSYAADMNHISMQLLDFLSDLERVENSLDD